MGDVARGELFSGFLRAVQHLCRDGGSILQKFFLVFGPDATDGAGDGGAEARDDFVDK
jgi:hypothetical protein